MIQPERWSLVVLGEALRNGATRFADFLHGTDLDQSTLAARLDDLVKAGLMHPVPDTSDGEPRYVLTERGLDLEDAMTALESWSERWAVPVPLAAELTISKELDPMAPTGPIEISLLGAFALRVNGENIAGLSVGSQRLLAFLALHDRAVTRVAVAGGMWPDATEEHAGISLRSALSRLDSATRERILVTGAGLGLAEAVAVDLRDAQALAHRLLQPGGPIVPDDLGSAALATLSRELLPDWYDDWAVAEAEDWRQLRMSGLEALARILVDEGRLAEAASAARAAMKVEPLRESAHASLIRVHLAEGNQTEALRVFDRYCELLMSALQLEPTEHLSDLVAQIRGRGVDAVAESMGGRRAAR
jgi:DNA-binding SARP family transcriptional activator/DNA-binding HxlR family transcriptional regulator